MTEMIRYNGTDFERVEYRAFLDITPSNHGIVSIAKLIDSLKRKIVIPERDYRNEFIEPEEKEYPYKYLDILTWLVDETNMRDSFTNSLVEELEKMDKKMRTIDKYVGSIGSVHADPRDHLEKTGETMDPNSLQHLSSMYLGRWTFEAPEVRIDEKTTSFGRTEAEIFGYSHETILRVAKEEARMYGADFFEVTCRVRKKGSLMEKLNVKPEGRIVDATVNFYRHA
jgi:hypothetical protein